MLSSSSITSIAARWSLNRNSGEWIRTMSGSRRTRPPAGIRPASEKEEQIQKTPLCFLSSLLIHKRYLGSQTEHLSHYSGSLWALAEVEDRRDGSIYALIISFIWDECQYHFHGSVMKIAICGVGVEFANKYKFAAQLLFGWVICVKLYRECQPRPQPWSWTTTIPNPWDRTIPVDEMGNGWLFIKSFGLWTLP